MFKRQSNLIVQFIFTVVLVVSIILIGSVANGQEISNGQDKKTTEMASSRAPGSDQVVPTAEAPGPVYTNFMGVTLGMHADEVRAKLGKLKDQRNKQDFYVFSESKSAQVVYDANGIVTAISVDYIGRDSEAPSPEEVLGYSVKEKADGSVYELKRYKDAGYWVAYSRTAGENPITTVTMQKTRVQK